MTWDDYEPVMERLVSAFPQRPIPEETLTVYYDALREMDPGLFRRAAMFCRDTCDWFPTISQLRRAAEGLLRQANVLPAPAEAAWERVLRIASGWHEGIAIRGQVDDVTYRAVRAVGGMPRLAHASDYTLTDLRRQFIDAYGRAERETVDLSAAFAGRLAAGAAAALTGGD